jgi:hypothetical protein
MDEIARWIVWTIEPLLLAAAGVSLAGGIPRRVRIVPLAVRLPLAAACIVYVVDAVVTWSDQVDCESCLTGPSNLAVFLSCWGIIVVFGLIAVATLLVRRRAS